MTESVKVSIRVGLGRDSGRRSECGGRVGVFVGREKRPSADRARGKMPGRRSLLTNGDGGVSLGGMTDRDEAGLGSKF